MNRRRLLSLAGLGLAGVAGCVSDSIPASDDPTTDETTATPTTDDGTTTHHTDHEDPTTLPVDADVSVLDATVTPAVVAMNSPDSVGVFGSHDRRYVLLRVLAGGDARPDYDEFVLHVGGTAHAPVTEIDDRDVGWGVWGYDHRYGEEHNEGLVAFSAPAPADVSDGATVSWPGGEYAFPEGAVAALGREPTSFSVESFDAPASVDPGENPTVSFTVRNTGDVRGTFVAGLNHVGPTVAYAPWAAASVDVAAGGTATWEKTHDVTLDTGQERVTYHLDWLDGHDSRTVECACGTNTAAGTTGE